METKIQRPSDLFYANVQYEVPLFQRPYVWDEDHQWSYVWEDISTHAESIIRGEEPRPHFFGSGRTPTNDDDARFNNEISCH